MATQKAFSIGSSFPELTSGLLRIYSSRVCPFAERARLVLAHKNIPHEVINIALRQKPEWFLALAPHGGLPVLQIEDKIINESTAVSEYLDDVYPGDKLQPEDPYQKAKDRILLEYFKQLTSSMYSLWSLKGEEDIKEKTNQIRRHFQYYEDDLAKRGSIFFGGSKPAMIDFYLFPHLERLEAYGKLIPKIEVPGSSEYPKFNSEFPKFNAWWEAMTQLPAVKKEMFDTEWHHQVLKLSIEGEKSDDYGLTE